MTFGPVIDGRALPGLARYIEEQPQIANTAARIALNDVAAGAGMKLLRQGIEEEVDFPAGYLGKDKLYVSQKARDANLTVVISAARRPTSLARFVQGDKTPNRRGGVKVRVKRGGAVKTMERAFLVKLRAGKTLENFNVGLAIRLKEGERIINKREQSAIQLTHNVYLLYGPSVDQVFSSVAYFSIGEILEMTETEFLRQYVRMSDEAAR